MPSGGLWPQVRARGDRWMGDGAAHQHAMLATLSGGGDPTRPRFFLALPPCSVGFLRVEAEASTDSRPLPGFSPRAGTGLPFGIMGRSSTAAPARPDLRVNFQFDRWVSRDGWVGGG